MKKCEDVDGACGCMKVHRADFGVVHEKQHRRPSACVLWRLWLSTFQQGFHPLNIYDSSISDIHIGSS
jgi:hypothetical protein